MGDDAGRAAQPGSRRRVGSWGLSDAPLASGECVSASSGVFVASHRADDTSGETRDSEAADRPGGVAVDAVLQGERDVLRAACRVLRPTSLQVTRRRGRFGLRPAARAGTPPLPVDTHRSGKPASESEESSMRVGELAAGRAEVRVAHLASGAANVDVGSSMQARRAHALRSWRSAATVLTAPSGAAQPTAAPCDSSAALSPAAIRLSGRPPAASDVLRWWVSGTRHIRRDRGSPSWVKWCSHSGNGV